MCHTIRSRLFLFRSFKVNEQRTSFVEKPVTTGSRSKQDFVLVILPRRESVHVAEALAVLLILEPPLEPTEGFLLVVDDECECELATEPVIHAHGDVFEEGGNASDDHEK